MTPTPPPSSEKSAYKRTRVLIDPKFQLGLIGAFVGTALLANLVIWITFYQMTAELRNVAVLMNFEPNSIYNQILSAREATSTKMILMASACMALISATIGLSLSHRIIGPIYNLRRHLTRVAEEGHLGDVKFRDKDYFIDLEEIVNRLMHRLRRGDLSSGSKTSAGTPPNRNPLSKS